MGTLVIECVCGKKISLVPDVQAMSRAISEHVSTHKAEERGRIEQHLVSETIVAIFSMEDSLPDSVADHACLQKT